MKHKPPFYEIGDRRYPSVTTVLSVIAKPALVQWAANEASKAALDFAMEVWDRKTPITEAEFKSWKKAHRDKADKALDIGTWLHDLMDFLLGVRAAHPGPCPDLATGENLERAAKGAVEGLGLRLVENGRKVWRDGIGEQYAGTFDAIVEKGGLRYLVDWKTSSAVFGEMHLQTAAYVKARLHVFWEDRKDEGGAMAVVVPGRAIVRLDKKTGGYEWVESPLSLEEDYAAFIACLKLYNWQTRDAAWRKEGVKK